MKRKTIWILGILLVSVPLVMAIAYQVSLTQEQEQWLQEKASLSNQSSDEYLESFISDKIEIERSIELQSVYNDLVDECRQDNACMEILIPILESKIL